MTNHVLIAGAGPVGLVAANCLADAGIPVTVFEAEPRLPENLRASTFQPPTLDMLSQFGASRRLIEMGRIARRMQYRDRSGWVSISTCSRTLPGTLTASSASNSG
jgi:2-polyprenyl-6-methoxyphenol hydroxylase-like FAD-dependent oxidoreductase